MSDSPRRARTREPERRQGVMRFEIPDQLLPEEHAARIIWRVVETLNLDGFVERAKALDGVAGRSITSVRMLLTLWLYAISEGIGSGREIERKLSTDTAFQWIVSGERVGRSTINSFRAMHGKALDKVFTDVLASLVKSGLVALDTVAQDGTRIRASASAPSFRREASLKECREQAALHLRAVLAASDDAAEQRAQRAREAKARDLAARVDAALATVKELEVGRSGAEPRASTTDPEARVMKMADGGFRPAYNVQFATAGSPEGGPRTIVGARVVSLGSDMGSIGPMLDDIERRTGQLPKTLLADANHASFDDIAAATSRDVEVLVSVPHRSKNAGVSGSKDPAVLDWKRRMETAEAKEKMRARGSLCELSNAHAKSRFGLGELLVRGLAKVTTMVLLTALTANILAHGAKMLA